MDAERIKKVEKLLEVPAGQDLEAFLRTWNDTNFPSAGHAPLFIRNAFITRTQEEDIREAFHAFDDSLSPWARGMLAFFLFTRKAEDPAVVPPDCRGANEATAAADRYLQQAVTAGVLQEIYEIRTPDLTGMRLSLVKVGSRHYVVSMDGGDRCLRLLKPYLLDITGLCDETLPKHEVVPYAKARMLHAYAKDYLGLDKVRPADEVPRSLTSIELQRVFEIIKGLCSRLRETTGPGLAHLNVTPAHIQVLSEYEKVIAIRLTGHGYNRLTNNSLGSSTAHAAQIYLAPEVISDPDRGSCKSDAYSIGIILLELMSQQKISRENFAECINETWRTHPELAVLIQELIEENVEDRFDSAPDDCLVFDKIASRIGKHGAVDGDVRTNDSTVNVFIDLFGPIRPILEIRNKAQRLKAAGEGAAALNRRASTESFAEALHLLTLLLFVVYTQSLLFGPFANCCLHLNTIADASLGKFLQTDSAGQFWGRLVAFSFSYVCAKYFVVNLEGINASSIPAWLGSKITVAHLDWFVRLGCCAIWWTCILLTMLWEPHWWPYFSGIGMLSVTVLNFRLFGILKREAPLLRPPAPPRVVVLFKDWRRSAAMYTLMLFIGGLALQEEILHDEWMYALIVSLFVNVHVMGRHALNMEGPPLKATFARIVVRKEIREGKKRDVSLVPDFAASA